MTPGPQKSICPKETTRDLRVGPAFAPVTKQISIFYLEPSRQAGKGYSSWGHQAGQGKGNDSA